MPNSKLQRVAVALAVGAALVLGYRLGAPPADPPAADPHAGHGHAGHDHAGGAPAEAAPVWTCSMHPQIQLPERGLCPLCGMDLIPLAPGAGDGPPRELRLTDEARRLARIRTAPVERRWVSQTVRLAGKVTYDVTRVKDITAWFPGRIDRMFVDFVGMPVREGDHLYQIYSPELLVAHQELLQAGRGKARGGNETLARVAAQSLEAVRAKLRRWGLAPWQLRQLEAAKSAQDRITLYAPQSGVIVERARLEGSYVDTGTLVYRIADLNWVWIEAWAFEQHLPWLRFGQKVAFEVEALPGRRFEGQIAFIDPFLDDSTRATRVRISVPNPDGLLKPGLFARVTVLSELASAERLMEPDLAGHWICPMHPHDMSEAEGRCTVCGMRRVKSEDLGLALPDPHAPPPLVIPATAPLLTGERAVVYVEVPDAEAPTYEGREVQLGPRAGDAYLVVAGLKEGERVVTEGNFKLDAELQIRGRPSMMNPDDSPSPVAPETQPAPTSLPAPTSQPASHAAPPSQAPAGAPQGALAGIYTPYLAVQVALAADDAQAAARAWRDLRAAVGASRLPGLSGEARAALRAAVAETPSEIEPLRAAFGAASKVLVPAAQASPALSGQTLYRFHCPMAFDDAGADWLQADAGLLNPYFGASMLRCGSLEATLQP